ncbi:hypothetical protein [Olegusella massiliensis]|uniref:hypothetical protein n=1 Tax=Olegusella massiliensis TaxID=1776381 RepID=UPI0023F9965F|nr:hypothetical protein [Olegusella massiliensis]
MEAIIIVVVYVIYGALVQVVVIDSILSGGIDVFPVETRLSADDFHHINDDAEYLAYVERWEQDVKKLKKKKRRDVIRNILFMEFLPFVLFVVALLYFAPAMFK